MGQKGLSSIAAMLSAPPRSPSLALNSGHSTAAAYAWSTPRPFLGENSMRDRFSRYRQGHHPLRRMVVRNPRPKGTVLFLHGFPETLYAWKDISLALADDYEVHAFDCRATVVHRGRRSTVFPMRLKNTRVFSMDISQKRKSTDRNSRSTRQISALCRLFSWRWRDRTPPG